MPLNDLFFLLYCQRLDDRLQVLNAAKESYTKARNEFAAKQVDDEIKLVKYQRRLEEELKRPYMDLSLHQTIHKLIIDNSHKMAEQLRREFKVPDKRYWWLRIDALAEAGEWTELDKFSKTKKPPLGMEAFVEVCLKFGNKREAIKYVPRVLPDKKVQCLIKVGDLKAAAESAFENRSEEELNRVLRKCTQADRDTDALIRSYKQQLATGRK